MRLLLFSLAALLLPLAMPAIATPALRGPYLVESARAIDGDTIEVVVLIWLDQRITTRVRVAGIDTPEKRGKCAAEREAAAHASRYTAAWLERLAGAIVLVDIERDKYGGRIIGRLVSTDGHSDLGTELIAAGLARPYGGKTKQGWC